MSRPYRILILEDLPSDSALIEKELRKSFGSCDLMVVDGKDDFTYGLHAFKPDIVLSDYSIPGFDWYTAFKLTINHSPGIPFIIVSGSTNMKIAGDCLKAGALDFVSKDNIKALGPAITRILENKGKNQSN